LAKSYHQAEEQTKQRTGDPESAFDQMESARLEFPPHENALGSQRAPAIPALTSVRFFLAIAIVCIHYRGRFLPHLYDSQLANSFGLIVPAFYCLSGFVLTYHYRTLGNRVDTLKYLIARVARVVPLYWFCLFLALSLGPVSYFHVSSPNFVPILLANLFLLQSWFTDRGIYYAFNPPAYSLSAEVFFYVAFPLIVFTSAKKVWPWLVSSIFFMWLLCVHSKTTNLEYFYGVCPIAHLPDFVMGVAAARYFIKFGANHLIEARLDFWLSSAIEIIFIAAFICWSTICGHLLVGAPSALAPIIERCLGVLIFAILIYTLARQKGFLARLFKNGALIALGEASYATYLLHDVFIQCLAFHHYDLKPLGILGFVSFCAFTLVASLLAYTWIEQPWRHQIIQWGNRYILGKSTADGATLSEPGNDRAFVFRRLLLASPKTPELTLKSLVSLPLLLLVLVVCGQWFIEAMDELPFCQQTRGCTEASGSQNILFGDSVRLLNLYERRCTDGIEIKAFWCAAEHSEKAKSVGVHIVDRNGSISSQYDHHLLPQTFPLFKGAVWCDRFKIPNDALAGANAIALSVFDDPQQTLLIRGGHCDWGNHRLLLPLQAN